MLALGALRAPRKSRAASGSLGQPPHSDLDYSRASSAVELLEIAISETVISEIVSRASFAVELLYCDAISAASGTCGRGTRRGRVGEGRVLGRVLDTPSAAKSERGARRLAAGVAGAGAGGSAALDASCVA